MKMKLLAAVGVMAVATAPAHPKSIAQQLNGWQATVVGIGEQITTGIGNPATQAEYNSSFNSVAVGTLLAPAAGGRTSSLDYIGACVIPAADISQTQGGDIPTFDQSGEFAFGAGVTSPPSFLSSVLGAFGLSLKKSKAVKYDFAELAMDQATRSTVDDVLATPSCRRQLRNVTTAFIVRGHVSMKLAMSQGKCLAVNVGTIPASGSPAMPAPAAAATPAAIAAPAVTAAPEPSVDCGKTSTTDPTKKGFNVSYRSKSDWRLTQKAARPWFRIVSKVTRQPDGSYKISDI